MCKNAIKNIQKMKDWEQFFCSIQDFFKFAENLAFFEIYENFEISVLKFKTGIFPVKFWAIWKTLSKSVWKTL